MSYDLAVWEGIRPPTDEAGAEAYEQIVDLLESDAIHEEPSPAIRAYVEALLARWPDITTDAGDESPWASGPLMGEGFGGVIYVGLVWSQAEEASEVAAQIAHEHGLVCYDPQAEILRPDLPPTRRRRWFAARS